MRSWRLCLYVCIAGCFSESGLDSGSTTGDGCMSGAAGCDCNPDGSCGSGLECLLSIEKCIPIDCQPGTLMCNCSSGGLCFGALACEVDTCQEPAGTGPDSSATNGTVGDGTSGAPTSSDATATTNATSDDASAGSSTTGSSPEQCAACLSEARLNTCSVDYGTCTNEMAPQACNDLQGCIFNQTRDVMGCCEDNAFGMAHANWNAFVDCALADHCPELVCAWTCAV